MAENELEGPSAPHKRRGRPPLREGGSKRASFNTRITPQLKQHLERAAEISGRSLSEEIEYRLDQSIVDRDRAFLEFSGRHNYALAKLLAAAIALVEEIYKKPWIEDPETHEAALVAVLDVFAAQAPMPAGEVSMQDHELAGHKGHMAAAIKLKSDMAQNMMVHPLLDAARRKVETLMSGRRDRSELTSALRSVAAGLTPDERTELQRLQDETRLRLPYLKGGPGRSTIAVGDDAPDEE